MVEGSGLTVSSLRFGVWAGWWTGAAQWTCAFA